jgi:hypothetical protein
VTTPSTFGTVYQIIRDAMVEAGYLGRGREPTSDHLALYTNKLNYIFNYLQTRPGLKLWLNFDLPITLVAGRGGGTNPYTLGPTGNVSMTKPIRGFEAYYTDFNQNRRPIMVIGRSEWDMLSTVTQQGNITSVFVDKQLNSLNVYTWLVPDTQNATGILHLVITQQVGQMVSITDTMSFPVEWYLTIMWQLAAQICTGQPPKVIERCTQMADVHLQVLEDWDVEDASTTFTVDQRGQGVSRFR